MNINNFLDLVKSRNSCRNYLAREIPKEFILNCLEAARLAPSACNKQPWKYIIVENSETILQIAKEGLLPFLPMPWFKTAPAVAVICAETKLVTHKLAPILSGIDYRLVDAGISGEHFVLAAEAQGLSTCWIGWFKEKNIKKILNIPKNIKVISLITLGFSAEETKKNKEKHSISEITYFEKWGTSK